MQLARLTGIALVSLSLPRVACGLLRHGQTPASIQPVHPVAEVQPVGAPPGLNAGVHPGAPQLDQAVLQAVLEEEAKIDAAAAASEQEWKAKLSAASGVATSAAAPAPGPSPVSDLKAVEQRELAAARYQLAIEAQREQEAWTQQEQQALQAANTNKLVVRVASEQYARSKAQNAIAYSVGTTLNGTIMDEEKAEQFRIETAKFAHIAKMAADQSARVEREAEAAVITLPPAVVNEAVNWITLIEKEAQTLKDEAAQSEHLSSKAGDVTAEASTLMFNGLTRATAAESKASSALNTERQFAAQLSTLHSRAMTAQQQASSAGNR